MGKRFITDDFANFCSKKYFIIKLPFLLLYRGVQKWSFTKYCPHFSFITLVSVGFHCIIGYWLIHVTNRWFLLNLVHGFNNRDQAYFLKYVYGNENCLWYDKLSHKTCQEGPNLAGGLPSWKSVGFLFFRGECMERYTFELCMNFCFNCLREV